jgi:hypothetical protein
MKAILKILFSGILLAMLFVTITASIDRNLFEAASEMWAQWWFKATLADAYFGFLTFFLWVAYKERQLWIKVLWFVLIMCLGNLAMASYMLIELFKLGEDESLETLLTRRNG